MSVNSATIAMRGAPFSPAIWRAADRAAEPRVALRACGPARADGDPAGSADAGVLPGGAQGELGAEHGGHADALGRFGEAHHPVEAVVVGERQRLEAEARRLFDQLFGVRRPVEEAEVRVAVQLGVGHRRRGRRT